MGSVASEVNTVLQPRCDLQRYTSLDGIQRPPFSQLTVRCLDAIGCERHDVVIILIRYSDECP